MNGPLFLTMLRTNGRTLYSFAMGSFAYVLMIVWLFPQLPANLMNTVLKTLPSGYLKAFGVEAGLMDLNHFLSTEYYGLLYLIILMIYSISTPTKLIAGLVDQGSMGYLLTASLSRTKVITTQMAYFLFGLVVICAFTTFGGFAGDYWVLDKPQLVQNVFLQINLVGFLMFAVVGGYSFLFSASFADEKKAMGASTSLTILFYAANLASKLSDKLSWLRHFTLFSLFDPAEIAKGKIDLMPIMIGLSVSAVVLFILAGWVFKKRDLPL